MSADGTLRANAGMEELSEREKLFAVLAMAFGMFMALIDIQIVASSLAEIQAGLAATADEISEIQTSYLVAEVIMIPLSGWFSRMLSTRWLFTLSAAGFTAASAACACAWNIESMIVFRAIQGFLGGAMIPTAFATGFALFPGAKQARVAAILGMVAMCAPAFGPTVGGYITELLDWRWLFFINLLPGLMLVLLVPRLVRVDRPDFSLLKRFDFFGMATIALFLGCLQYVLDEGPRNGWFEDAAMLRLFCISMAAGVLFVWRSLSYDEPLMDLRAFRNRNFTLGCMLSFVIGVSLYGMVYLTPLFLGHVRGWNSMQVGSTVFVFGLSQVLATPLVAFISRKIDARWLLAFGFSLYIVSTWLLCDITSQWGFDQLLLSQILRGIASMTCIVIVTNVALGALTPVELKGASGLYNLMRNLGGAIGLAALNTQLFYNRFELHYDRLASGFTAARLGRGAAAARLEEHFERITTDPDAATHEAASMLARMVSREAYTLSFADMFLLVGSCFFVALLLIPLVRSTANQSPAIVSE